MEPTRFVSIGAGPFEFPIAGSFVVSQEGGATTFEASDGSRRYYVGSFNNVLARGDAEAHVQIDKIEQVTKRAWEQFVASEKGVVRVPFERTDVGTLAIFFMATEFTHDDRLQYYVQYAVSNGPRLATVFAEGLGPALPVHSELLPVILGVKVIGVA